MYVLLPKLLEGVSLKPIDRRWRPRDLLVEPYRRQLLKNMRTHYARVSDAIHEFETLVRGERYIKHIYKMKMLVKQAEFAWRFDDLIFIKAISDFYLAYGTIVRLLAIEKARGTF